MHPFPFYLQLGFEHISNLAGYDHILFLVALCAIYRVEQWRTILILVTAFTIGHSTTLALVSFSNFTISTHIIKFLIPMTIFITSVHNVVGKRFNENSTKMNIKYIMSLFFGFIHGMDFSNYFKALLFDKYSVLIPLLGFNLGIELGQLLVIFIILIIAFGFLNFIGIKHREWNLFISGSAAGISIVSMFENRFW